MIGIRFPGGRAETTVGIHSVTNTIGGGAQCVSSGWKSLIPHVLNGRCLGFRAHRTPSDIGIDWHRVMQRKTYCAKSGECLEIIMPKRDCLSESEARGALEYARNIVVDVVLAPAHVSRDTAYSVQQLLNVCFFKVRPNELSRNSCAFVVYDKHSTRAPCCTNSRRSVIDNRRPVLIDDVTRTGLFGRMSTVTSRTDKIV